jgi:S1-C subfamily serine protease
MVAVASIAAAAILVGAGVGHLVWSAGSATNAIAGPNSGSPSGSGSSGSGSSPFGSGSSGSGSSPFGSGSSGSGSSPFGSGSSGNSSTGAGAPSDISAIASKVDPGLVDINTNLSYQNEQAAGTGMVLTPSGEVLTNNHVIDGATSITVTDVGNGKTYTANVVGYDRTGDVAVIKLVGASGLQTVATGTGSAAIGQAVVGVGNAGGAGGTPSAAGGSVTATDQSITASDNGGGNAESLTGLIEINAGIQPGDSGGPLVNTSGQVIGMDTAAAGGTGYQVSASQAYAIPIATALSVAGQIESGHASSTVHIGATGFLGVEVQPSGGTSGGGGFGSGGSGSASGTTASGAVVEGTLSGSPAQQAGLVQGDVITAFDGKPITTSSNLSNRLEADHPGDTVQLQWTDQSGQTHTANVKLVNGPAA